MVANGMWLVEPAHARTPTAGRAALTARRWQLSRQPAPAAPSGGAPATAALQTQPRPRARRPVRLPCLPVCASSTANFHQNRMKATERTWDPLQPLAVNVEVAEQDDVLRAAAWLRARCFYVYPPERKFAGELHREMMAEEEYGMLKVARMQRRQAGADARERSACVVAVGSAQCLLSCSEEEELALVVERLRREDAQHLAVVGSLDLHAVKALPGEVLIGNSEAPGYLANVCVLPEARRRGIGESLLDGARSLAQQWGVKDLYVHTMAVNEVALRFYERNGFVVEKEETSNQAHYRGRCLDGIEGRGRTVLLRDTQL